MTTEPETLDELRIGLDVTAARLFDVAQQLDQQGSNIHIVKGAIGWMRSRATLIRELLARTAAADTQTEARLRDVLAEVQCFSCGTKLAAPVSLSTREQSLDYARRFDAGEMDRTWPTNVIRLPFWRRGVCFMCDPLKALLRTPDSGAPVEAVYRWVEGPAVPVTPAAVAAAERHMLLDLLGSIDTWLGNGEGLLIEDVIAWRDRLAAALGKGPR